MAEDLDNAGSPAPDGGDNGEAKDKVVYTPEQQQHTQKLIDDAYRKSGRKWDGEKAEITADFAKKMDDLRKEVEVANNKKPTSPEGVEEHQKVIETLQATIEEQNKVAEAKNESLRNKEKVNILFSAVGKQDVIDPQEVVSLLSSRMDTDDDGNVFVKGEGGSPKLNQHGEVQNVEEFVLEWLSERPHHLRGSNGGAGSLGGHGGGGSVKYDLTNPETWKNLPKEDFDRLMNEGVVVHRQGNQAPLKFKNVGNKFIEAKRANNKTKR